MRRLLFALLVALGPTLMASSSTAEEGGSSHYVPGTQGDFAMALVGPKGFYVRNDVMYLRGRIAGVTLGNGVYTSARQRAWVNVTKGIYLGDRAFAGARWGAVLSLPVVLDAKVSGELAAPLVGSREGSRGGLGDASLTGLLNWTCNQHHVTAGMNIYAPTGSYDKDRVINLGRNYWSFDPTLAYTWLDAKRGHEVSLTAGFMLNTENRATNYTSGNAFHLDFTLAQHFSKRFALGLTGYAYRQVSDDRGPLLDRANTILPGLGLKGLGGFRGQAFGLGGAVSYTASFGRRDVTFVLKGMTDLHRKNRMQSDALMFSVALKL